MSGSCSSSGLCKVSGGPGSLSFGLGVSLIVGFFLSKLKGSLGSVVDIVLFVVLFFNSVEFSQIAQLTLVILSDKSIVLCFQFVSPGLDAVVFFGLLLESGGSSDVGGSLEFVSVGCESLLLCFEL